VSAASSFPEGSVTAASEGKILAAKYAASTACRTSAYASPPVRGDRVLRGDVLGTEDANSTEFDNVHEHPVIDFMPDQRTMEEKGGTMRLGLVFRHGLTPGSKAEAVYGTELIYERHRHRFEVNNRYRPLLEAAVWSSPDKSPGRAAGRDRRVEGPPLVRCEPVPPGVPAADRTGRTLSSAASWERPSRCPRGASRNSTPRQKSPDDRRTAGTLPARADATSISSRSLIEIDPRFAPTRSPDRLAERQLIRSGRGRARIAGSTRQAERISNQEFPDEGSSWTPRKSRRSGSRLDGRPSTASPTNPFAVRQGRRLLRTTSSRRSAR